MLIPQDFYESEIREGFYVPAKMKRAWAVMLTVLNEIDKVCRRHGLKWWMDWGTLIGVVRHRGFIPWDDDLDISMLRRDYMIFNEVANDELPEGYFSFNIHSDESYRGYNTRVANSTRMRSDESFLEANSGLPYMSGVDIMCIDYMNPDENYRKEQKRIIGQIDMLAASLEVDSLYKDIPALHSTLDEISGAFGYSFSDSVPVACQLYRLCERLMSTAGREEAESATCMGFYSVRDNYGAVFPKEYYEELITMPCEFMEVPVPLHYDEMLRKLFGDYLKPYRPGGTHDYPFYCRQENLLKESVGRVMWDTCRYEDVHRCR